MSDDLTSDIRVEDETPRSDCALRTGRRALLNQLYGAAMRLTVTRKMRRTSCKNPSRKRFLRSTNSSGTNLKASSTGS